MKFILDKSQLKTFLKLTEEPMYKSIKFIVEPHKNNGLQESINDSFWIRFIDYEDDVNFILQTVLHTGLRHNFNKYFLKSEPCY